MTSRMCADTALSSGGMSVAATLRPCASPFANVESGPTPRPPPPTIRRPRGRQKPLQQYGASGTANRSSATASAGLRTSTRPAAASELHGVRRGRPQTARGCRRRGRRRRLTEPLGPCAGHAPHPLFAGSSESLTPIVTAPRLGELLAPSARRRRRGCAPLLVPRPTSSGRPACRRRRTARRRRRDAPRRTTRRRDRCCRCTPTAPARRPASRPTGRRPRRCRAAG